MTTLLLGLTSIAASESRLAGAANAQLTVTVHGQGSVRSEPAGIDCGTSCTLEAPVGTSVRLIVTSRPVNTWTSWDGACVSRADVCTVVLEGPTTVDVTFGATSQLPSAIPLNVTTSVGGKVTATPAGFIDCGVACTTAWPPGGELTLQGQPESGYDFVGWLGSCSGTAPCRLILSEPRAVSALFRPKLTVVRTSTLGIVNRNPPPLPLHTSDTGTVAVEFLGTTQLCEVQNCSFSVPDGVVVTLTPDSGTLRGWEGACSGVADVCQFVMNGPLSVTVGFKPSGPLTQQSGVNVARAGRGLVKSIPAGIECGGAATCAAAFGATTNVKLSAEPAAGWTFAGWSGDCGGAGTCTVRADAPRSVTAIFRLVRHSLRVAVTGKGSVLSTPPGISCPSDCSFAFPAGEPVSLTAAPAAGSRFTGWRGACSGTTCSLDPSTDATAAAGFDRCATLDFASFGTRAMRSPRRVRVSVALTGSAKVLATVRRKGVLVVQQRLAVAAPASRAFALRVGKAGRYAVSVRVTDGCGASRTSTRSVNVG